MKARIVCHWNLVMYCGFGHRVPVHVGQHVLQLGRVVSLELAEDDPPLSEKERCEAFVGWLVPPRIKVETICFHCLFFSSASARAMSSSVTQGSPLATTLHFSTSW